MPILRGMVIGLLANNLSADAIAAAIGKIGAFVGTWVFPILVKNATSSGGTTVGDQAPVYLSSGLCLISAVLAFFFLPHIDQNTISSEDLRFRQFLEENGWDTTQMGIKEASIASSN